ncbi:hypothetical protein HN954_01190 [bacterium]|jgi:hypothetical protein|nr:hypothetical protein [bacterium]MBT6832305.1 hypothetical protein [bacterium]MBT6996026.1 hypothetical protein [bacterium]MBT7772321.1 hypothetical protein [bacterium]
MSEESVGGLDDLLMGDVSEGSEETQEQLAARISAAQAKLAAVQKDEKTSKNFDDQLAKILKKFSVAQIKFVAFLIDHEVPSLTILAMFSIDSDDAGKIAFAALEKSLPVDDRDEHLPTKFSEKISLWWRLISAADAESKTLKLADLRGNSGFTSRVGKEFPSMLSRFLNKNNVQDFDPEKLKKMLKKYEQKIFAKK